MRRFWEFYKKMSPWIVVSGFLAAILATLIPVAEPFFIGYMIIMVGPAFLVMEMEADRERKQRYYDKGFKDGTDARTEVDNGS